ncbi:MAG: nucleotidyltransferase family protein [Phaeodactylibacter sp.]|nr:nucleotidyltransferase family protein [Phaeodactylibacter sp.]
MLQEKRPWKEPDIGSKPLYLWIESKIKMEATIKLNKERILGFLENHKADLRRYKVRTIGLFGSYSRGEENNASDIDLLVEYETGQKTFDNFIGLIDYLEKSWGKSVELVTRESASKYILPYIEKEVEYVEVFH